MRTVGYLGMKRKHLPLLLLGVVWAALLPPVFIWDPAWGAEERAEWTAMAARLSIGTWVATFFFGGGACIFRVLDWINADPDAPVLTLSKSKPSGGEIGLPKKGNK